MNVDRNNLTVESPFIVASVIIILSCGKTFIENKPSRLRKSSYLLVLFKCWGSNSNITQESFISGRF